MFASDADHPEPSMNRGGRYLPSVCISRRPLPQLNQNVRPHTEERTWARSS